MDEEEKDEVSIDVSALAIEIMNDAACKAIEATMLASGEPKENAQFATKLLRIFLDRGIDPATGLDILIEVLNIIKDEDSKGANDAT